MNPIFTKENFQEQKENINEYNGLLAVILYHSQNKKFIEYLFKNWNFFNDISANDCLITTIVKKKPGWTQYWLSEKNYQPYERDDITTKIAQDLGINYDLIPCIVFFSNSNNPNNVFIVSFNNLVINDKIDDFIKFIFSKIANENRKIFKSTREVQNYTQEEIIEKRQEIINNIRKSINRKKCSLRILSGIEITIKYIKTNINIQKIIEIILKNIR